MWWFLWLREKKVYSNKSPIVSFWLLSTSSSPLSSTEYCAKMKTFLARLNSKSFQWRTRINQHSFKLLEVLFIQCIANKVIEPTTFSLNHFNKHFHSVYFFSLSIIQSLLWNCSLILIELNDSWHSHAQNNGFGTVLLMIKKTGDNITTWLIHQQTFFPLFLTKFKSNDHY